MSMFPPSEVYNPRKPYINRMLSPNSKILEVFSSFALFRVCGDICKIIIHKSVYEININSWNMVQSGIFSR